MGECMKRHFQLLRVTRSSDNYTTYFVNSKRVSKASYDHIDLMAECKDCFITRCDKTHVRHWHSVTW